MERVLWCVVGVHVQMLWCRRGVCGCGSDVERWREYCLLLWSAVQYCGVRRSLGGCCRVNAMLDVVMECGCVLHCVVRCGIVCLNDEKNIVL